MTETTRPRRGPAVGWAIVAITVATATIVAAPASLNAQTVVPKVAPPNHHRSTELWAPLPMAERAVTGTLSCASGSCHGQSPDDFRVSGRRRNSPRQEYSVWLEHDPHAQSTRTLTSPAFRRILLRLSGETQESAVTQGVYARCAACHDPQGLAIHGPRNSLRSLDVVDQGTRGIGCEACHGPATAWLASHYERGVDRAVLRSQGQLDNRNLLTRGRVCAACHVGDDRHDMNHDMIAAGHPPLRFELSSYHDLLRVKHWSDNERIDTSEFKTRLWGAGQWAAADATLGLLIARAERATAGGTSSTEDARQTDRRAESGAAWPELAEYDCLGCHQRLRPVDRPPADAAGKLLARSRRANAPAWQPWYFSSHVDGLPSGDEQQSFSNTTNSLRQRMRHSILTDPHDVAAAASAARTALRRATPEFVQSATGHLTSDGHTPSSVVATILLDRLEQRTGDDTQSWSLACHDYLLLKAAYLGWRDAYRVSLMPLADARASLANPAQPPASEQTGEPAWCGEFESRLAEIAASLQFGSTEFEWPAYDWAGLPGPIRTPPLRNLATIRQRLQSLATELRQHYASRPAVTQHGGSF